jgi:Na+/H+-dicarboxylate symporter
MKKVKIALHIQIMLALVLGVVFGSIFSVDSNKISIEFEKNGKQYNSEISNWDSVYVIRQDDSEIRFSSEDQLAIVKSVKKYSNENLDLIVKIGDNYQNYTNIVKVSKIQTIATLIKPLGDLFIRLLSFLAIPLVVASLIVGASSLGDIKQLGRIGSKTFALYLVTTGVAITIGLVSANLIKPGNMLDEGTKTRLLSTFEDESAEKAVQTLDIDIVEFFVNIVPKNPIDALASGNMIQIVFFAVIFGITLTYLDKNHNEPVIIFFEGVSQTMIKMVDIFMKIAPLGVFALISATVADFGFEILETLIWYSFTVVLALAIQTIFVYGSIVKIFSKIKIIDFFKGMRNAHAIAFSTSSSAATLPLTFDCVENNLGVSKKISGFVLPLGATINMDGTALYQGVAAVFIAQVYGMDLTIVEQLTIIFTAVLASIGTAPVPGVGLIMLVLILNSVNIPPQGIALILGIDRILDMLRTITNVTGDASVAVAIDGIERKKGDIG